MNVILADSFTDSLARLTDDEQKAVKLTAFDLQLNPAHPSFQFHKLEKARDQRFCSVRVNLDVRLIVHRTAGSLLLCYVHHHDQAYAWAERRKLETHPKTGAAQLVEIRETVQEIVIPRYVQVEQPKPPKPALFAHLSDEELLSYGVPPEWLADVQKSDEDSLLQLADHLPAEAAEALLDLATGAKPKPAMLIPPGQSPFEHPDAQRRFRVMSNLEELEEALNYPWEKWIVFLHPAQRQLIERSYNGPARVSGSAGTGKTIVALHRAAYLARANPHARILLTTFSDPLCSALAAKLRSLVENEPQVAQRIEVHSLDAIGRRLYEERFGPAQILSREALNDYLKEAAKAAESSKFSLPFLRAEWNQIGDAWQLETWEAYRDVPRLGRRTRLPEKQRAALWSIFEQVKARLMERNLVTWSGLFTRLASHLAQTNRRPFDFAVVDEAQDIRIAQLRFLAALGANERNRLFFAGDLGQRIFSQPFSWKSVGVDIRGRSAALKINYRTSHQIRLQADRLLGPEVSDVDGNREERTGTISLFNGPPPQIQLFEDIEAEVEGVTEWLRARTAERLLPHEIAVFVRSEAELSRAQTALKSAQLPFKILDEHVEIEKGRASLCTMHLAKGLEFRAVAVMACDDEIIPSQERIETVSEDSDLEEVQHREAPVIRSLHARPGSFTGDRSQTGFRVSGRPGNGYEMRCIETARAANSGTAWISVLRRDA